MVFHLKVRLKSNTPIPIRSLCAKNLNVSSSIMSITGTATVAAFWAIRSNRGSSQPAHNHKQITLFIPKYWDWDVQSNRTSMAQTLLEP